MVVTTCNLHWWWIFSCELVQIHHLHLWWSSCPTCTGGVFLCQLAHLLMCTNTWVCFITCTVWWLSDSLFACLFVPYTNLCCCKERLKTLRTRWRGPGACYYGTGVQLPAQWEKTVKHFLSQGLRCHFNSTCHSTIQLLEMLQASKGGQDRESISIHDEERTQKLQFALGKEKQRHL